jgi:hypothetical protein
MDTRYTNQVFHDWLVLNSGWKYFQIIIFLYVCSTWSTFELKECFETWNTCNDVNGVSLFKLSYLITIMAYLCSERKLNIQIKYFMFEWSIYRLFVLNRGWERVALQINIFEYIWSRWAIVELKTRFQTWITRNDVNGVSLFLRCYLITLMV